MAHQYMPKIFHDSYKKSQPTPPPCYILNVRSLIINKPLSITYKNCLEHGVFRDVWKKGMIIPVHKITLRK